MVSFDIIKLLSAYMIVFFHFARVEIGYFDDDLQYHISLAQFFYIMCSSAIPLFFMVNGALLLNKDYSVNKIYGKAAKLALIIFVWSFTGFPSWFLQTLIGLYLFYPILIKIYNNKILRYILMSVVFLIPFFYNLIILLFKLWYPTFSFSIFGREISLNTIPNRTGFFTTYSVLYFFLGGIFLNRKLNLVTSCISVVSGYVLVLLDLFVSSMYLLKVEDIVSGGIPTIGTLLMAVGLFNILRVCDRISNIKILKVIQVLSFGVLSIYLFHMLIFKLYYLVFPEVYYPVWLVALLSLSVCALCCGIAMILKNIPLIKELIKI